MEVEQRATKEFRGGHQSKGGGTRLVIVESPAKARTIAGYLGQGYVVESSIGHIRDMPDSAADIPAKYKGEPWARLGVNVDDDFEPLYVVHSDKKQQVAKLKSLLKDADELFLATDEDREGEAIAWHLLEELKPKVPTSRMVFHEITPEAIAPRHRQPAAARRRQGRRLPGPPGPRPAVRVRGLARAVEEGHAQAVGRPRAVGRDPAGRGPGAGADRVPRGRLLRPRGRVRDQGARQARGRGADHLHRQPGHRRRPPGGPGPRLHLRRPAEERRHPAPGRRGRRRAGRAPGRPRPSPCPASSASRTGARPYAPFRTTTLQQEASRKLGFSAKHTMSVAQRLYENGYITYMRTDSVTLSQTAISAARKQAAELYGANYVPDAPRTYASKVKNAQEAHEAIRPAGRQLPHPGPGGQGPACPPTSAACTS